MCLRTSTAVCQADVAHLDHWLLWRCDPVQFVLSTTFRNLAGNHLRAGALHLSLLSHKRQALKVCVPLFLFDRRNKGDPNAQYNGSHVQFLSQGIEEGTPMRYVPCLLRIYLAEERKLSVSDCTQLNPRPMCGRRSRFSTLGSKIGVNKVNKKTGP